MYREAVQPSEGCPPEPITLMKSRCRVVLTHLKRSGGARLRHRFFSRALRTLSAHGTIDTERPSATQEQTGGTMAVTSNGSTPRSDASTQRCPRRIVLLRAGEESEVERVLLEYRGAEISGKRLHADVPRLADEHRGRTVAAEWQSALGWTRFLWCRQA